jgi:hypothetical protein
VLIGLGACAVPLRGTNFARPDYRTFSKESIEESEILAKYGPPFSRGTFTKHDRIVHTLQYRYETSQPVRAGRMVRKKVCWFYFAGDEYLGFDFSTGFEEGQSAFDDKKVAAILKGVTRKGEVIAMFGAPSGAMRYPATPEDETEDGDSILAYEYNYLSNSGESFHNKSLLVTFGKDDVVKDVRFDSRDRDGQEPAPPGNEQLFH